MSKLDDLLYELTEVQSMPESEVMKKYNVDSKSEYIQLIKEDILVEESSEMNSYDDDCDIESDYDNICRVQGLSRYC